MLYAVEISQGMRRDLVPLLHELLLGLANVRHPLKDFVKELLIIPLGTYGGGTPIERGGYTPIMGRYI